MAKVTVKAVEIGLVYENLDPEKTYVSEQINPVLEQVKDVESLNVKYVEGKGWIKTTIVTGDMFDKSPQLEERGFTADRKDVATNWILVGEGMTATITMREYGATEPLCSYIIDSSGLIIDASEP